MRKLFVAACAVSLMLGSACAQDADHLKDFRDKLIWKTPMVKTAFAALFNEAINSPTEWGRGPSGFAKRAGNSFGQRTVKASLELAFSPLTHEDLHFRRYGEGSVWTRVKHTMLGTFWVERDDGGPGHTLAAGRITGAFAAARGPAPPGLVWMWRPIWCASFGPASDNRVEWRLHARQRYLPHLPDGRHAGPAAFPDSRGQAACLHRPVDFGHGDGPGLRDAARQGAEIHPDGLRRRPRIHRRGARPGRHDRPLPGILRWRARAGGLAAGKVRYRARRVGYAGRGVRSEEHTSELQSLR